MPARHRENDDAIARYALSLVSHCETGEHPYLAQKGFSKQQGLLAASDLIIPMIHYRTKQVRAYQRISPNGEMGYWGPNRRPVDLICPIGRGPDRFYCQDYVSGLSIMAALESIHWHLRSEVWVCFTPQTFATVANTNSHGYVITDHDLHRCQYKACATTWDDIGEDGIQTIEKLSCPRCGKRRTAPPLSGMYAAQTGLPYWTPPEELTNANDYMLTEGLGALGEVLQSMIRHIR